MTPDAGDLAALLNGEAPGTLVLRDVPALAAAADRHGITALIWRALERQPRAEPLRELLGPVVLAEAARDVFVQRELQVTLGALADAGVAALPVKGAALAYTAYGQPWLRPRTDTDVLIAHRELTRASTVLEARGYRRTDALTSGELVSHQVAFERRESSGLRHVLDLHWKIVNPQLLAGTLPFDDLWARAIPAPMLGAAARVPHPVHSLAIAAVHRLAHHQGHERLIWLHDVLVLTRRFDATDWARLTELAVGRRIAGLCLDALTRTREVLDGVIPCDVETALAHAAPHEPSHVYLVGPVRKRDVLLSDLGALGSWRSRWRLLREHAFPPAAFIRRRYGVANRWPLPALYFHRLVTGAMRWGRP